MTPEEIAEAEELLRELLRSKVHYHWTLTLTQKRWLERLAELVRNEKERSAVTWI